MRDVFGAEFQWKFFLVATLINIALGGFRIIGGSIKLTMLFAAREMLFDWPSKTGEDAQTIRGRFEALNREIRADLNTNHPLGRTMGIVERQLYLYFLVCGVPTLIASVVLFKAFSGWLKISDPTPAPAPATTPTLASNSETVGVKTLARYYSYAVGNFLSLAWAILIFEALRIAMAQLPEIKSFLTKAVEISTDLLAGIG